jgi:hypothetical protein
MYHSVKELPMSTPIRTSPESDHRRRPRTKRIPCARDQAIFVAYRTAGRTQAELAHDYRLSQSRIGQIVRRVELWRSTAAVADSSQTRLQRQRLDRRLEQERLQAIYDRGIRGFDHAPQELRTVREGDRGGKPFHEETRRQQPPNTQLLKAALGASRELNRLADKCSREEEAAPEDAQQKRELAARLLYELRHAAQQVGHVPCRGDTAAFVRDLIKSLVGEPNAGFWKFLQDEAEEVEGRKSKVESQDNASRLDLSPETLGLCSNASNCTNPASSESVQDIAAAEVAAHKAWSEYEAKEVASQSKAVHRSPTCDTTFDVRPAIFDSARPRPVYQLDDPGWQPSPPMSRDELAERNRDYQEYLRQQREARQRAIGAVPLEAETAADDKPSRAPSELR